MIRKLFEQSEGWVTRLRNRFLSDPFFTAQVKLVILFFIVGSIISVVVSDIADHFLTESIYTITTLNTGDVIRLAFNHAERSLWFWRTVKLILTVLAAYFLVTFAFRPVKKSAELQKRFAAIASHELRTPLAIIRNTVEVALRKKETLTLEKAIKILESNKEEVERLTNITEFLMIFSKIKEIKGPFPLHPTDITAVARKAITFIRSYGPSHVHVELRGQTNAMINGDKTSLKLLLVNLLKNAVDHTPSTGKVWIDITENDSKVFLSVGDTGSGIDSQDLPYIFEPFYSGKSKDYDIRQGGVGLGLSIVKQIATLHNAVIALERTGAEGTIFKMTFDKIQ